MNTYNWSCFQVMRNCLYFQYALLSNATPDTIVVACLSCFAVVDSITVNVYEQQMFPSSLSLSLSVCQ